MKYHVTIISEFGWLSSKETNSRKDLLDLRTKARQNAAKCLPWSQYDKVFRHLVYYYELPDGEVRVEMRPRLVDDQTFYDFVDRCKPDFVGAIHRQELV